MLTFRQFLENTVEKGAIDTLFEERLFLLVGTLERIARPLAADKIPYELIGGGALWCKSTESIHPPYETRKT